jgi:hypothetical protein
MYGAKLLDLLFTKIYIVELTNLLKNHYKFLILIEKICTLIKIKDLIIINQERAGYS